jgi:assimilatory nitrate reductase catalytic subunit
MPAAIRRARVEPGALPARPPMAQPYGMRVATHCPYCAMQCGMDLVIGDDGRVEVEARDFPINRGGLCQKGWTSAALLQHPERLTRPLMRAARGGALREVTWEEALDRIVAELGACGERYGREAVGVFGGGGLTNEKAYALGKFARVALRTPSIDYNGRFCMSSAAVAVQRAFGVDRGLPFPLEDVGRTDAILLVGGNPAETLPLAMPYLDEQQAAGGALIVVDPRRTATAARADLHLQPLPGTDLALANGLLHIAVQERLIDEAFIDARTSGFTELRRRVRAYWPDRVERITGVAAADLERAVRILAGAPTAMVLTARGPEQQRSGSDIVSGYINLALALGHAGRPRCGFGTLTGQGNGQGGREHGQKADQLPGYRRIDDPAARAHIAAVWGVAEPDIPGPGRSAWEMLDGLGSDGGVRALLVMGSNPAVSAPASRRVRERLEALDFLAVSDLFLSETAELADVVLPVAQWAEEDGTTTNLEGRVIRRRAALAPPPGVRTDLEVLAGLAERLGCGERFPSAPRQIFDELRRASAGGVADYSGISYERLDAGDGTFWPCPDEKGQDTPRLFLDAFATPDGRARFHPVDHRGPEETTDDEYPLYLTTGRILRHYQSGTQTRRVGELRKAAPEPFVELHPSLAQSLSIADGEIVSLESRRGRATGRARVTADIRPDTVFMPFHWGGSGAANRLTNPALDPASRMPEFKVCAVRLERSACQSAW